MERVSYQQILAETYEETSRNLLVHPNEYEDDEQVEEHEAHDYEVHDLPDKELFNKFQERHDIKNVIPPKEYEDNTRNSVRYDKDVKTHIVDIDSRFRAYPKANFPAYTPLVPGGPLNTYPPSNVANFTFALPKVIKNAITVRLTSICFPNVFYTFSKSRENLKFKVFNALGVQTGTVTISEGNYPTIADLLTEIQSKLTAIDVLLKIDIDTKLNKIRIYREDNAQFGLDFTPDTIREPYNNGLGYNLGFEQFLYGTAPGTPVQALTTGTATNPTPPPNTLTVSQAVAETFPDILGDSYVYLQINDYDVIEHQNFKQTFFPVFAKIMLPFNTKNQLITDIDLLNVVERQYNFLQPINIQKIVVTVYDAYGNIIDMKGSNFSFTLQIEEILNPALYEKLRDL
jgi:hypothetical protein